MESADLVPGYVKRSARQEHPLAPFLRKPMVDGRAAADARQLRDRIRELAPERRTWLEDGAVFSERA